MLWLAVLHSKNTIIRKTWKTQISISGSRQWLEAQDVMPLYHLIPAFSPMISVMNMSSTLITGSEFVS